mgnify:CR=1 FL=1
MQDFIRINEKDNVVVALRDIAVGKKIALPGRGEELPAGNRLLQDREIVALEEIPAGHKMAVCDIPAGGQVIKYGYCIGNAKEQIRPGAWIHVQRVEMALSFQTLQHPLRMTAVAKRSIQPGLPRPDLQEIQDLLHADGDVHPRRSTSLADNLLYGIRILFRLQLLVFFLIISWMCSFVTDTPFVCCLHILYYTLSPNSR